MSDDTKNQGEGNKEAARNYNKEQRDFIKSEKGQEQIDKAVDIDTESNELREAVEEGKAPAKG